MYPRSTYSSFTTSLSHNYMVYGSVSQHTNILNEIIQGNNETSIFITETSGFITETSGFINETSGFINETSGFIKETSEFIKETS